VGAVVVLMGVIAMRPMLKAGYDVRLASGVITAGGTLGILIPPSVMLIVYAAVAGQSIVKLYAAAMVPGFFLTFLYLVYIIAWAMINPKIAPPLDPSEYHVAVPDWIRHLERGPSRRVMGGLIAATFRPGTDLQIMKNLMAALIPLVLTVLLFAGGWWYVTIHNAPAAVAPAAVAPAAVAPAASAPTVSAPAAQAGSPQESRPAEAEPESKEESPQELSSSAEPSQGAESPPAREGPPEQVGNVEGTVDESLGRIPEHFYASFWALALLAAIVLGIYYWRNGR
jgi:hypothetical protein